MNNMLLRGQTAPLNYQPGQQIGLVHALGNRLTRTLPAERSSRQIGGRKPPVRHESARLATNSEEPTYAIVFYHPTGSVARR